MIIEKYNAPMVANAGAAPVLPLPTRYKPSCSSYGSFASSVAPASTTSSSPRPGTSAYRMPSFTDVVKSFAGPRYSGNVLNFLDKYEKAGPKSSAPEPKPAMVRPEAIPFLSGNH